MVIQLVWPDRDIHGKIWLSSNANNWETNVIYILLLYQQHTGTFLISEIELTTVQTPTPICALMTGY